MFVLIFCLALGVGFHTTTAWMTDWDRPFTFSCPRNQMLQRIESIHNNGKEDRVFNFFCADLPSKADLESCEWSGYTNDLDKPVDFRCPRESIITGIESYHRNRQEDRRYKFKCCTLKGFIAHGCRFTAYVNGWDQKFDYRVPNGLAIKGVYSVHNNKKEDRLFKFDICKLSKVTVG